MAKEKWKSKGANAYIMRVISEGYTVPFRDLPPSKVMKNNKSARDNISFVNTEVANLLKKRLHFRSRRTAVCCKTPDSCVWENR